MLVNTRDMLFAARQHKYAVGAFNVYNLEGALSVVNAAQELKSPVILQVLPTALDIGGAALIHLCRKAGASVSVPVAVHLDHCSSPEDIRFALEAGVSSTMADGSMQEFDANIRFTRNIVSLASRFNAGVEGELGRLSGQEDGLTIEKFHARLTQPEQAEYFVEHTRVWALAVCIGNIHGTYKNPPNLDFERLAKINKTVTIPLVLHGTSGLPDQMIIQSIQNGVCKFNVNTEVRQTYLKTLRQLFKNRHSPELVEVMKESIEAMKPPIKEKIQLFGSANQAV